MKIKIDSFPRLIKAIGLPLPMKEYLFDSKRKWQVDYAWPDRKLAVEIEGGIFGTGRKCPLCGRRAVAGHTSIQRLKTDMEKYNALTFAGWSLLRFLPEEIASGKAVNVISDWFDGWGKDHAL